MVVLATPVRSAILSMVSASNPTSSPSSSAALRMDDVASAPRGRRGVSFNLLLGRSFFIVQVSIVDLRSHLKLEAMLRGSSRVCVDTEYYATYRSDARIKPTESAKLIGGLP